MQRAFASYLQSKLAGSLPPADRPEPGAEIVAWTQISEKAKSDIAWMKAGAERDEKFSMHINSLASIPILLC